jgi:hypothetical protein
MVAAFDQSFDGKAGKKTWGRDYFWNGCASKAEKGGCEQKCYLFS